MLRYEPKRGGLEVIGWPNSGKSFIFGAIVSLFVTAGYTRPNKNCTFNWDNCRNKVIICTEECRIDEKDYDTFEVLKDVFCGNQTLIREKGKPGVTLRVSHSIPDRGYS